MGNKGRLYLAEPPLSERLRLFRFSLKAMKSDQRRCLWTLSKALPLKSGREHSPLHPVFFWIHGNYSHKPYVTSTNKVGMRLAKNTIFC